MDALVLLFATWIAAHTGLAIPPSPSVVVVSAEEMRERSGDRLGVVAFYTRDTATIYLPQGWNSAGIYDRAMLLHELVHHMQQLNRVKTRCGAERERQAYDLTRAWLSEQGISDPYTFLNLDELTVTILSHCPDADGLLPPCETLSPRNPSFNRAVLNGWRVCAATSG